jgi:hypothetical protein
VAALSPVPAPLMPVSASGDGVWLRLLLTPARRCFNLAPRRDARLELRLEAHRLIVLFQELGESHACQLLEALTGLMGKGLNCLPRLVVELNTFARHAFHFLGSLSRFRGRVGRGHVSSRSTPGMGSRTNFGFNMRFH